MGSNRKDARSRLSGQTLRIFKKYPLRYDLLSSREVRPAVPPGPSMLHSLQPFLKIPATASESGAMVCMEPAADNTPVNKRF